MAADQGKGKRRKGTRARSKAPLKRKPRPPVDNWPDPHKPPRVWLRNALGQRAEKEARLARRIAFQQMKKLKLFERELSLSIVGDAEIRKINREWRQKDTHTDVITFPLLIPVGSLGDIIISLPTARRQAKAGGWTLEKELRRLMAHGLMHCEGLDHQDAKQAWKMAWKEEALLGEPGMVGESWADVLGKSQK